MKKVILLLAFAGACAAQTSPTIVKTVSLVNETKLAGSKESPVSIFTTTQDGFYRMTLLIRSETQSYIIICPTYPGSSPLLQLRAVKCARPIEQRCIRLHREGRHNSRVLHLSGILPVHRHLQRELGSRTAVRSAPGELMAAASN